uniref:Uncharacterized protein n=1 Tax=Trypanosoma congolense (strain IL3000) TaxID=1068625 RepID=G0V038_TRYCI|nr:hypothetical protein, unlikely [Trypanosoma congolense IL3000]
MRTLHQQHADDCIVTHYIIETAGATIPFPLFCFFTLIRKQSAHFPPVRVERRCTTEVTRTLCGVHAWVKRPGVTTAATEAAGSLGPCHVHQLCFLSTKATFFTLQVYGYSPKVSCGIL